MTSRHAVLIHGALQFSSATERMLATASALREQGHRVTIVSTPGSRAGPVRAASFEVCMAELPFEPLRAPLAAWRTRETLVRLEPHILHVTDDRLIPLLTLVSRFVAAPCLIEIHRPVREPIAAVNKHLASVIVPSESLVEGVVNRGRIKRSLVRVIKNAPRPLDADLPPPFEHEGLHQIGCSGLLDDNHSAEWFLEAARLLLLGGAGAHFTLLGEGPHEDTLRRRVRELGLADRITVAVPTTARAAETLAALDVHVSCRMDGGADWLACQAMAQGIPSVLAAVGDTFDLIEDRRSGILVEPGNARLLADELSTLIFNPRAARAMGANGRARVREYAPPERFDYAVAEAHAVALGTAVSG